MRAALLAMALLGVQVAHGQASHADPVPTVYVGGMWFEVNPGSPGGIRFVHRDTTWAERGVFVDGPIAASRVVDLGDAYIVPPFGDAHLHALYNAASLASEDSLLVAHGVFTVLNPHVPASEREAVRGLPTQVSVVYAVAGITAPGAHPLPAYEAPLIGLQPWDVWGPRGDEIRSARSRNGDAYRLALNVDDVDAIWPAVLASRTGLIKVYLDHSEEWAEGTPLQPRGLSPEVVSEIVRRAHDDGLRVAAHVVTAADAEAALFAGVDLFVHVPGFSINDSDPGTTDDGAHVLDDRLIERIARAGIPVVPTLARGLAMVRYIPEAYRPDSMVVAAIRSFHADLLQRLSAAGVPILIGADSGGLWAWDEAAYLVEIGGLTPAEALRAWSVSTPQAIAPSRDLGRLVSGYEASLLALDCDPTVDFGCTLRIRHREVSGVPLGLSSGVGRTVRE